MILLSFYTLLNEITCKKHILVSVSSVSVSAWGLSLKCNQKGGAGRGGGGLSNEGKGKDHCDINPFITQN